MQENYLKMINEIDKHFLETERVNFYALWHFVCPLRMSNIQDAIKNGQLRGFWKEKSWYTYKNHVISWLTELQCVSLIGILKKY